MFADIYNRLVRNKIIQGKALADPVPQFRGTDGQQMSVATMQPQAGDIGMIPHRVTRPFQKDELDQSGQFGDIVTEVEFRQLVTPDDPVKFVAGVFF